MRANCEYNISSSKKKRLPCKLVTYFLFEPMSTASFLHLIRKLFFVLPAKEMIFFLNLGAGLAIEHARSANGDGKQKVIYHIH